MILTIEILAILTMCTIMFILVWGFITLNQMLSQLKYKNYLMEQLTQHMHTLAQRYSDFLDEDSSK
jgi:hypothetical protein